MKTIIFLAGLLCLVLAAALPALAATDQRGVALRPKAPTGKEVKGDLWLLTIGINSYLSWPQLKTAVNDARSVKKVLLKRYHLDPANVIELTDDKATRHNILGAFRDLAKQVKPEDSLIVYYAGHGHIDPITGKGSWIPVESGTDDPTAWIDNRNITDYLNVNAIKAKHVLMVSDSCFSGDFFRGNRGALPTIDDAFLKRAYQRSSRQAISSGGLEPVSDAGFGGNSVFSYFLVAALESNTKQYLIPSEIFSEIKAGVGSNADQLPQFGDLHGTGGQDGGELILFLKGAADNRLQEVGAASAARQKELEQLRKAEQEAATAKQKEQQEIARKQAELDALDKQIAEMKGRLGTNAARSSDSLDAVVAMVEQKEQQAQRLEELRQQREAAEQQRQQEFERLRKEAIAKRTAQIKADFAKYQKVASSKYGQDMKSTAWDALVSIYPEAKEVTRYDEAAFLVAFGLAIENGEFIPIEEKQQRDQQRQRKLELAKNESTLAGDLKERYLRKFENDVAEGDTRFLSSDDIQFGSFLRHFETAVYGVWHYPQEAAQKGIEGITPVRITFNRRGEIVKMELLESSGSRILDDEVLRTLRAIGPVGSLPRGYDKEEFHLIAFFQYGGARRSLR